MEAAGASNLLGFRSMKTSLASLLITVAALGCATPDPFPAPLVEDSVNPGINENYLADDLDVAEWQGRFEVESREIFANRDAIVGALAIEPGMDVADIGAGTGVFQSGLAAAVGSSGTVFQVDLVPTFVEHLRARATAAGLDRVEVVQCTERSVELAEASIDLAIVCDTYHHFEYPRSTLASVRQALRPGGRLFVVDFERIPGVSREFILGHVRAGKEVFRAEIEAAGFELVREIEQVGLAENYMLEFRRL